LIFDDVRQANGGNEHCKMDDAASSIRQYVAALSRLLLDFVDGEFGRCDGCRVELTQFDPFTKHFASPYSTFFRPNIND
jgi:hypothetical protein